MLEPIYTKRFRKELKLAEKRGRDLDKLLEVIDMIADEQPLPPHNDDHPLHGKLITSRGCHIQGDWVLVYKINHEKGTVTFHRTGSHADLF